MAALNYGKIPYLIIACLSLAACKTTEPAPRVVFRDVRVPVVTYCVKAEDIPPEPALIGSQLSGDAARDIGPIAISASELRKAFRIARALLVACVKPNEDGR